MSQIFRRKNTRGLLQTLLTSFFLPTGEIRHGGSPPSTPQTTVLDWRLSVQQYTGWSERQTFTKGNKQIEPFKKEKPSQTRKLPVSAHCTRTSSSRFWWAVDNNCFQGKSQVEDTRLQVHTLHYYCTVLITRTDKVQEGK